MKITLIAAIAALALGAAASAQAGEANNEPFPVPGAGAYVLANPATVADTGSQAFPAFAGQGGMAVAASETIQPNSSQAEVESANSLPRGFAEGTVAYAQAQSVRHYLEAQIAAQDRTRVSQR